MSYRPENPLVVQSDRTVLLEVNHPRFAEIRDRLSAFAELVKSPEYVHVYRITPLSLWNAAAKGMKAAEMLELLTRYGKFPLPRRWSGRLRTRFPGTGGSGWKTGKGSWSSPSGIRKRGTRCSACLP